MKGVVEEIFVTGEGSAAMERVGEVRTIKGCGIGGSLLCGNGVLDALWRRLRGDSIEGEDLDHIENQLGIGVKNGEHRRNIVTRGIRLGDLQEEVPRWGDRAGVRQATSALQACTGFERARDDAGPQG